MKGTRVQSIIRELRGEKIDIVDWTTTRSEFVTSALSPPRCSAYRSSTKPSGSWKWSSRTSSSRWRSARRAERPPGRRSSPAGRSTSRARKNKRREVETQLGQALEIGRGSGVGRAGCDASCARLRKAADQAESVDESPHWGETMARAQPRQWPPCRADGGRASASATPKPTSNANQPPRSRTFGLVEQLFLNGNSSDLQVAELLRASSRSHGAAEARSRDRGEGERVEHDRRGGGATVRRAPRPAAEHRGALERRAWPTRRRRSEGAQAGRESAEPAEACRASPAAAARLVKAPRIGAAPRR